MIRRLLVLGRRTFQRANKTKNGRRMNDVTNLHIRHNSQNYQTQHQYQLRRTLRDHRKRQLVIPLTSLPIHSRRRHHTNLFRRRNLTHRQPLHVRQRMDNASTPDNRRHRRRVYQPQRNRHGRHTQHRTLILRNLNRNFGINLRLHVARTLFNITRNGHIQHHLHPVNGTLQRVTIVSRNIHKQIRPRRALLLNNTQRLRLHSFTIGVNSSTFRRTTRLHSRAIGHLHQMTQHHMIGTRHLQTTH